MSLMDIIFILNNYGTHFEHLIYYTKRVNFRPRPRGFVMFFVIVYSVHPTFRNNKNKLVVIFKIIHHLVRVGGFAYQDRFWDALHGWRENNFLQVWNGLNGSKWLVTLLITLWVIHKSLTYYVPKLSLRKKEEW